MFERLHLKKSLNKIIKKYKQSDLYRIIDYCKINKLDYAIVGDFIRKILENKKITRIDLIIDIKHEELVKLLNEYNIKHLSDDIGFYTIIEQYYILTLITLDDFDTFKSKTINHNWANVSKSMIFSNLASCWLVNKSKLYNINVIKSTIKSKTISMYIDQKIKCKYRLASELLYNVLYECYKLDDNCKNFLKNTLAKSDALKKIPDYFDIFHSEVSNIKQQIKHYIRE